MEDKLFEISASTVVVEVRDERTGKLYRRELPIDFYENANLLRLSGENLDGSTSQLVFYSARGACGISPARVSTTTPAAATAGNSMRETFHRKKK